LVELRRRAAARRPRRRVRPAPLPAGRGRRRPARPPLPPARARPLALHAPPWLVPWFAGLVAIYWISTNPVTSHLYNSSDRTIDALVIGGALMVPVLLGPAPERGCAEA